jgi:hypothetical protein
VKIALSNPSGSAQAGLPATVRLTANVGDGTTQIAEARP